MQVRERKTTWAFIRTVYDKDRGRGVARCLGTLPKSAERLPEELARGLTEKELQQAEALVRQTRQKRELERQEHYARILPTAIDHAARWYLDPRNRGKRSSSHANDTRSAFSRLLAAMVKAGVGRTRKRKSGEDTAPAQASATGAVRAEGTAKRTR